MSQLDTTIVYENEYVDQTLCRTMYCARQPGDGERLMLEVEEVWNPETHVQFQAALSIGENLIMPAFGYNDRVISVVSSFQEQDRKRWEKPGYDLFLARMYKMNLDKETYEHKVYYYSDTLMFPGQPLFIEGFAYDSADNLTGQVDKYFRATTLDACLAEYPTLVNPVPAGQERYQWDIFAITFIHGEPIRLKYYTYPSSYGPHNTDPLGNPNA